MANILHPQEPVPFSVDRFVEAEYHALRDEVLKHIEVQYQVVGATLLVAGAFLTVGTQTNVTPDVLLLYPILAIFLAAAWADNQIGIIHIGAFIHEAFESRLPEVAMHWEAVNFHYYHKTRWPLHMIAMRGLFVVSQLLAIFLAVVRLRREGSASVLVDGALLVMDVAAVAIALWLLRNPRNHLEGWKQSMDAISAGDAALATSTFVQRGDHREESSGQTGARLSGSPQSRRGPAASDVESP